MPRRKKLPKYASVVPDEEFFWRSSAQWRARLVEQVKKRPAEWRFALMFKASHEPESWSLGPDGHGCDVQVRVSRERNIAGYFVGWRSVQETEGPRQVYDYVADKDGAVCRAKTLAKVHRWALKRSNSNAAEQLKAIIGESVG